MELFSKKNHVLLSNFFFFKYVFSIRLFLAITYRKRGTVLVSSQTAVKGGHGFEIAFRMENLRSRDWDEIQNKGHRVRSMLSRSSLFLVVFMLDIANTEIHTWIEYNKYHGMRKSQDLMRFWSYESLFWTILYRLRSVFP